MLRQRQFLWASGCLNGSIDATSNVTSWPRAAAGDGRLPTRRAGVVPTDAEVMAAFFQYPTAFGLPELSEHGEEFGLVLLRHNGSKGAPTPVASGRSRRSRAMWKLVRTRQSVWAIVREEFDLAVEWVGGKSPEAAILKRVSTHWLRRTRRLFFHRRATAASCR